MAIFTTGNQVGIAAAMLVVMQLYLHRNLDPEVEY
jgi:hypothetical protein